MGFTGVTSISGNRNFVLSEVLRDPGVSRSVIAARLNLNMASVSRISRELIDAHLIQEVQIKDEKKGPGRRFVGLAALGAGGFIVGIGLNAFRQSVTLANLENKKIAEWVSPEVPGKDGSAFIELCLQKAAGMLAKHVPDRNRFFGAGIAVAGNLNVEDGIVIDAPAFGWTSPIMLRELVQEILGAPLVLDTPSSAINQSEAEFGIGKGIANVATLHCSLGFGLGLRKQSDQGATVLDFGRVLVDARSSDGSSQRLDGLCGGVSVLNEAYGIKVIDMLSDTERGKLLTKLVTASEDDDSLKSKLHEKGLLTGQQLSLVFDVMRPELLVLAGPLAQSDAYVSGFTKGLHECIGGSGIMPEIRVSDMTPTGASRWLSLRGNVALGNLDLARLKERAAA